MPLIALKGFAGSGKSTLGRALGGRLGYPVIDKDDVKDVLGRHTPEAAGLAYEVMWNVARRQLLHGSGVICDSPLTFPQLYDAARLLAAETGAELVVIECRCPDEHEWRRRIDGRKGSGMPTHHQTDWESFRVYRDGVLAKASYPISGPHRIVDTTRPIPHLVVEVMDWLHRVVAVENHRSGRPQPSREQIGVAVDAAVQRLLRHDGHLLNEGLQERAITHKLAFYLQDEFPEWHVDCEYDHDEDVRKRLRLPREGEKDVLPDIIVHRRGTDAHNLLVMEVKKTSNRESNGVTDTEKLRAFKDQLGYRYGFFLSLRVGECASDERVVTCREIDDDGPH